MRDAAVEATLFAGPSAFGLSAAALGGSRVERRPPVRRGDIDRLRQEADAPGVVVICDGVFQCEPAVSHAEIGRALDAGWQVWGCSSLGAIRAFELRERGMRGFGWVHALFTRVPDLADDELCLLHAPMEPWFPLGEPLVNLRYALERRGPELGITPEAAACFLQAARELWFGERDEARLRGLMGTTLGLDDTRATALWHWLTKNRVKTLDLARLMHHRPWRAHRLPLARAARAPSSRPAASQHPPA